MNKENQGNLSEKIEKTVKLAEKTARKPFTKILAGFGFVTKGVLFLVIGSLAALAAIGAESGNVTGAQGALATVAQMPFGRILLIIFIIGAIAYGGWNILRGVADIDNDGTGTIGVSKRIFAAGLGIFYLFLSFTASWILLISSVVSESADDEVSQNLTAILLALPLGVILVFLIGLGVLIAAFYELYSAISRKFLGNFEIEEITPLFYKLLITVGIISFLARSLLMALIGYFFMTAAINYDPQEVIGLDGALTTLARQTYGKIILFFTAFGLICHGILSILEAKFRRFD